MLDPLTFTTEVPCNQEKAFSIFVNDMGSWWPLDKRSMSLMSTGKPAKSVSIEPKLGGKIVELTADDEELLWRAQRAVDIVESAQVYAAKLEDLADHEDDDQIEDLADDVKHDLRRVRIYMRRVVRLLR